jgi:hypothetical protein
MLPQRYALLPRACTAAALMGQSAGVVGVQDKAENDLLGRSIARTLNIGLLLASIGHLLVFGESISGPSVSLASSGPRALWNMGLLLAQRYATETSAIGTSALLFH